MTKVSEPPATETLNRRYVLQKQLAAGSDSQVWQAQDLLLKLPVLVKIYLPAALKDWKRIQLIEREARILAQIEHLQIPDFVDFFTAGEGTEQTLYLVTEFVRGENLAQKLAGGWKPAVDEVLVIAEQVLEMLNYLHAFNPPIVHRDIKPSNLMMPGFGRVFVIDFGGVQEQLESQGAGGSTLVGTLGYMAPEQIAGRAVPATDLFALGMTLVHLLSDTAPEQLPRDFGPAQLKTLLPDLSEAPCSWIARLIEPDLEIRYASAQEAFRDLDLLRGLDFSRREFFLPTAHKHEVPDVLRSLNLVAREADSAALLAGSLLQGRYEIQSLIGTGTHSSVYRALARTANKAVMIKELRLQHLEHWKNLELFEREIAIQRSLHHPRIPTFVDVFKLEEGQSLSWYLVTAAIDGDTLEAKLETGWRPGAAEVWDIAAQALELLVYLQGLDPPVVHRDIKPSNLLLDNHNQLWLIDFGAVQNRMMSAGGGGSTIIGTFGYMAPEQYIGQASFQSDLYGLGATLVRLLSHRHPVEMPLETGGLQFRPFVSCEPFYAFWLEHCLAPQATERFATPTEALGLLRDYAARGEKSAAWLRQQEQSRQQALGQVAETRQRMPLKHRINLIPTRVKAQYLKTYLKDSELLVETDASDTVTLNLPDYAPALSLAAKQRDASREVFAQLQSIGLLGIGIALPINGFWLLGDEVMHSYIPPCLGLSALLVLAMVNLNWLEKRLHAAHLAKGKALPFESGDWRSWYHANQVQLSARGLAFSQTQLSSSDLAYVQTQLSAAPGWNLTWNSLKALQFEVVSHYFESWDHFGEVLPYRLSLTTQTEAQSLESSGEEQTHQVILPFTALQAQLFRKCVEGLFAEYGQVSEATDS